MMSVLVYFLCAATSALCALLLFREYRRRFSRLLLWSSISFAVFSISNALVFADFVIVPDTDLSIVRAATACVAAGILVVGLIWEAD